MQMLPEQTEIEELPTEARTRCEVWTRVMGYHRPVSAWNPGKQSEHAERRFYRHAEALAFAAGGAQDSDER